MTSANSLSLILRRLDEIERKLDRMLEETFFSFGERGDRTEDVHEDRWAVSLRVYQLRS